VGNAVKFTDQGEIVLRVTCEEKPVSAASTLSNVSDDSNASSIRLRFTVRDTGIGIAQNTFDKLFKKFSQVDASTTRRFGGTGLGLTIAKQLAEMMGGEIGVESEEGQGTLFWFTAWFNACGLGELDSKENTVCPNADIQGASVLVVDDNETNRQVLTAQLQAWGVHTQVASDGPQALQVLQQMQREGLCFHVAVLDMQMPNMDGIELAHVIRREPVYASMRLVLLTSIDFAGSVFQFKQAGFSAWLTKPVRSFELLSVLANVLSGQLTQSGSETVDVGSKQAEAVVNKPPSARVLLVEDNPVNTLVAQKYLIKMGLTVDAVENGFDALEALTQHVYDLVLMDVQMEGMDGYETTRRIRSSTDKRFNPAIPIIAMTAHVMQSDREKCLASGMNDYVSKPVVFSILVATIVKWLPKKTDLIEAVPVPGDASETSDIWDRAAMVERMMGDTAMVLPITSAFLDDIPRRLDALHTCLSKGDLLGLVHQAHTIKGVSANVGAVNMSVIASDVEIAGKAGDREMLKTRMDDLCVAFQRVKQAMQGGNHDNG
jgi:CheY-like chemotaxis protein/HPt (histidine-containing phosphotransfer) domain-containing protein